jgi:outer membrane biosynthesis protein TonB
MLYKIKTDEVCGFINLPLPLGLLQLENNQVEVDIDPTIADELAVMGKHSGFSVECIDPEEPEQKVPEEIEEVEKEAEKPEKVEESEKEILKEPEKPKKESKPKEDKPKKETHAKSQAKGRKG